MIRNNRIVIRKWTKRKTTQKTQNSKQKDHHKKGGTQVLRNSGTRRNADAKYPMFDLR